MIGAKVFAEGIAKQIKEYLPPEYADIECQVIETQKNNGVRLSGVNFRMPGQELSPTIYVDSFYNEICQGKEIGEVMRAIVGVVEESMKVPFKAEEIRLGNYEAIKEHLRAVLVNSKENRQMLNQMPHIETEDLSYMLCKEYGIDTSGYDFSRLPDSFRESDAQGVRAALSEIRDTAGNISSRMNRALEQNRQPKSKEQER